jgi:hypothetical protein
MQVKTHPEIKPADGFADFVFGAIPRGASF